MAALTPGYDGVAKVTIIPRTNGAGGFTLFTPSEDRMESGLYSYKFLKSQLSVALGGRVQRPAAGPRPRAPHDRAVGLPRGRGEPRQRQRAPRARRLGDARRRRPDGRAPDGVGHDGTVDRRGDEEVSPTSL